MKKKTMAEQSEEYIERENESFQWRKRRPLLPFDTSTTLPKQTLRQSFIFYLLLNKERAGPFNNRIPMNQVFPVPRLRRHQVRCLLSNLSPKRSLSVREHNAMNKEEGTLRNQ